MTDSLSQLVLSCPELESWPGLLPILNKRKPGTVALFDIAYQSTGKASIDPTPIKAAIVCFIVNCILIDDIIDNDEKGIYHTYGSGRTANLAAALHARQSTLIAQSNFTDLQKLLIFKYLNQMKLLEAQAQELATQNPKDLELYWRIVHGKSGNVCGTSMKIGALLGMASESQTNNIYSLGKLFGEVGQISNDLMGAFDDTRVNPDWATPGINLPIVLTLKTQHTYLEEFKELLNKDLNQKDNLKRIQNILIDSGAVSSCCDSIAQKLEGMYQNLVNCTLDNKSHLYDKVGQDISHAIDWVKDLDVKLSDTATQTLQDLSEKVDSLS